MNVYSRQHPAKVFVFLGEGFGAARWQSAWNAGTIPGICDRLPYGYFHAANELWSVTYSEDHKDSPALGLLRKGIRKLLGFDMIHAWFNREQLSRSDVIWTHTEREYLAVLCLWRLLRPKTRPKLIAQSVWLFDRWRGFSVMRRQLYRRLMRDADILTVLSPDNLSEAQRLFPGKRCELVRFGIDCADLRPPGRGRLHRPLRILSLGTDMHRDWDTFLEAIREWQGVEVRIASKTIKKGQSWPSNALIVQPETAQTVRDLYHWADFVVVTLKHNLHASGITVIAEAVSFGLPVICTDTGGLRAYFNEREIAYVAPDNAQAVRNKIEELAVDHDQRFELTVRAQQKMRLELTSHAYAVRHRALSESLLRLSGDNLAEQGSPAENDSLRSLSQLRCNAPRLARPDRF
jgi:glycosyltransferase involved in cell wall biosynthesis